MNLSKKIRSVINRIMPSRCIVCQSDSDELFCPSCAAKILAESMMICDKCGSRVSLCRCIPETLKEAGCSSFASIFYYDKNSDDASRRLILRLKTQNLNDGFDFLAEQMTAVLGCKDGFIVTNIPRRKSSFRTCAFDQAQKLAKALAAQLGCEYKSIITRKGNTVQKELSMKERIEAADRSYEIHSDKCRGRRILLVDDVVTTGASLAACTRLLYEHGAAEVQVVTAARSRSGHQTEEHTHIE